MPKAADVLKSIDRTRRNLFKAGVTLGAAGVALMFSSRKASAFVSCFLKGTRITTVEGEIPVEQLAIGDRVPTMFGGVQPIKTITRQVIRKIEGSRRERQMLVRIARGALAPDVPHTDLFVTRAHALHIDGVLATAASLVNGTTLTWFAPEGDEFEVYHVKLENHDVIQAEGAWCETMRRRGVDEACLPVVGYNGGRSEIRSRLRSAFSPLVDWREQGDILRDYIEEHGIFEARPFSGG